MRVVADYDRCEGHGMCEERASHLFRLDDEGDLHLLYDGEDLPTDVESDALSAVGVCPVAALSITP